MNSGNINSKKLTLQSVSKLRLSFDLSPSTDLNLGTTIVKKRKRKSYDSEEQSRDKFDSLTEKEQIFRINALQRATLLKASSSSEEKKEIVTKECNNVNVKKVNSDSIPNTLFREIEKKTLNKVDSTRLMGVVYDEDDSKKPLKVNKDMYSKHSKLIITQSIDSKIEPPMFKQRFGIRNRKSNIKGKNIPREVVVPDEITVKELSIRMAEDSKNVLKMLEEEVSKDYEVNDLIDHDIACKIVKRFNHIVKQVGGNLNKERDLFIVKNKESLSKKIRPPVVTFMGHVDHGKTSLLDVFRESNLVEMESGGITQHMSAYQVVTKTDQKITFIDTPGHEAFTAMRARGANVTDIVVIVIAADDGVMKQTIEAINHAKAAGVSIIVAINKIDRSQPSDIERIISSLPQYDLIPEELGGDVIVVPVSAKKKINLDKLEEAILFIADLMNLEVVEDCRACGWVMESKIDKARGISAMLMIEEGTLKIGDVLIVGTIYGKVRNMINYLGRGEKIALPSTPIEVFGLNSIPDVGDKFIVVNSEKNAREISKYRLELIKKEKDKNLIDSNLDIFNCDDRIKELHVVLKCDVTGSIEAISNSIDQLGNSQVKLNILYKGVGRVIDSDILLAEASKAIILAFNIKVDSKIKDLAKRKGVEIYTYSVIYELINNMKMYLLKTLKPVVQEVRIGTAYVKQIFNVSKSFGSIVGCYVSNGIVKKDSLIRIIRNGKLVHKGRLKALRRFKDDVKEVGESFECGMSIECYTDVKIGDILEVYQLLQEGKEFYNEKRN
ncbi:MAG: translation initiation factor IF-2 [Wolbachia endosymbiont of Menacanthus eurysternus]|nr:MAG: translation initiation factor IF-2 [Wolbachia endosymbiont of Menacanthus eurysternus]